jgi:hypothetical protein
MVLRFSVIATGTFERALPFHRDEVCADMFTTDMRRTVKIRK